MRYSDLKTSKFTKKRMAPGRRVGQRPDCHTFLYKFWHFQMAVSQRKLAWLTPNLGILWISVYSFWLCESIVTNPIIYRLVPRPSRFEIRQCCEIELLEPCFGLQGNKRWGLFAVMRSYHHSLYYLQVLLEGMSTKTEPYRKYLAHDENSKFFIFFPEIP